MIGWRPPPRSRVEVLEPSVRQRSVAPSAAISAIADGGDRAPAFEAACARDARQCAGGRRRSLAITRLLLQLPLTNVIRSTNCMSRRAPRCACAPFSMIEQNGQAVTTVLGAGVLELLEADVADARARLLFLVGEQQAAAGAAAVRVLAVALRLADVGAEPRRAASRGSSTLPA